ncbi:MAG TPA: helix-turn-helix domain-containing protein, partial [Trebonia sp.]|nr:helix-turn-helix domain-containing protein [Trebonia sp.]
MQERKRRIRSDATANRERVVQAAAQLFRERGVDVPLDEIAAASGVGSATLHRHFRGRIDLVHSVLDTQAAQLADRAGLLLSAHGPDRALRIWMSSLIEFSMSYRGLAALLAAHDADTTLSSRHEALTQACRQLLGAAQASGHARTAIDARGLLKLVHAIALAAADSPDEATCLTDVIMDGLLVRPSEVAGHSDESHDAQEAEHEA